MKIDLQDQGKLFKFSSFLEVLASCFNSFFGIDNTVFCAAYPNVSQTKKLGNNEGTKAVNTPIFTYKYNKVPTMIGSIDKNQELKPRLRGSEIIQENGENIRVEVYAQKFTYKFCVELWAETGEEAEKYCEKFQEFMASYSPYFIECGLDNIVFLEMNGEQTSKQWRTDLIKRTMYYRIDLDELVNIQRTDIKEIIMDIRPTFSYSYNLIDKKNNN